MRLDHIAYRTKDRYKTSDFLKKSLRYKVIEEFKIEFGDGTTAECVALAPPEPRSHKHLGWVRDVTLPPSLLGDPENAVYNVQLHTPPEIFVSDGVEGSIVGEWVSSKNDGKGGIHHMAYQVEDIEKAVMEWKNLGVEFLSEEIMSCPGLKQIFTTENELTGVIYELIQREGEEGKAFCKENVKALMESTVDGEI